VSPLGWRRFVPIPIGLLLGVGAGALLDHWHVGDGWISASAAFFVFAHALVLCFVPPFREGRHRLLDYGFRRSLWFYALPLPIVAIAVLWTFLGLFEGSIRLEEGTHALTFAAPFLGAAWAVDHTSRHLATRFGTGWLRTPLQVLACWLLALSAALVLTIAAPKLAHYPMYGTQWLDASLGRSFEWPWIVTRLMILSGIHCTTLAILVPFTEALWRLHPPPPTIRHPSALYAVFPAALLQLAWMAIAWFWL